MNWLFPPVMSIQEQDSRAADARAVVSYNPATDTTKFMERHSGVKPKRLDPYAPYEFSQPPDRKIVLQLVAAQIAGTMHSSLGTCVHDLRRQLCALRRELGRATPGVQTRFAGEIVIVPDDEESLAYRTALLRDLARASEQLRECEAALLTFVRGAHGRPNWIACPRCHRTERSLTDWIAEPCGDLRGTELVLEHYVADAVCSGTGEVRNR